MRKQLSLVIIAVGLLAMAALVYWKVFAPDNITSPPPPPVPSLSEGAGAPQNFSAPGETTPPLSGAGKVQGSVIAPGQASGQAMEGNATQEPTSGELDLSVGRVDDTPLPGEGAAPTRPAMTVDELERFGEPETVSGSAGEAPQDKVISWLFVEDVARWLVSRYHPEGTHPQATSQGILTATVKEGNLRYGGSMRGLRMGSADLGKARRMVLSYVLRPRALNFLNDLYADRFVDALAHQAVIAQRVDPKNGEKRPLKRAESRECLELCASWIRGVGGCLQVSVSENVPGAMERYLSAVRAALEANARFSTRLAHYQDLQEKSSAAGVATADARSLLADARQDMDDASDAYRAALTRREAMRTAVLEALGDAGAPMLTADERLYVAQWAFRRLSDDAATAPGLATAAELLAGLADHVDGAARVQ